MAVRTGPRGQLSKKRLTLAFYIILLCYLGLVGRLAWLQLREGSAIRARAIAERTDTRLLPANRGSIYARDGTQLAVSLYSGTVGFDPKAVYVSPQDPNAARKRAKMDIHVAESIQIAAGILKLPEGQIAESVRKARENFNPDKPVRFVPIKKDVSWEIAHDIERLWHLPSDSKGKLRRLVGFGVADGFRRAYARAGAAAQTVGYMRPGENRPAAGLELTYNRWLEGTPGKVSAEKARSGWFLPNTLQELSRPEDGWNVYTALDPTVQQIALEAAQKVVEKYTPAGISVIVLKASTGDVEAMVSLPTFDPNPKAASADPDSSAPPAKPRSKEEIFAAQWERATTWLYEPGSVVKSLTVAAALERHDIRPTSGFYCPGFIMVSGRRIKCDLHGKYVGHGHGTVTPLDILRLSCNIGAAQVGRKMGAREVFDAMGAFGLFDPLDIGLPSEKRGIEHCGNEPMYTDAKIMRVAFGHSVLTTPMHVALAYAAIANGGNLMKPRLVTSLRDMRGNVRVERDPSVARRVLSEETSAEVRRMLRSVVSEGTGKLAAVPGYMVAGKTGTAKLYPTRSNPSGGYICSFTGFLPAGPQARERYVIQVVTEQPRGSSYAAEVSAPAFQEIAERLMAHHRIPEDDPDSQQYRTATKGKKVARPPVPH